MDNHVEARPAGQQLDRHAHKRSPKREFEPWLIVPSACPLAEINKSARRRYDALVLSAMGQSRPMRSKSHDRACPLRLSKRTICTPSQQVMQCSKNPAIRAAGTPALLAVFCRISLRLMIALRFLRIVEYHFCELGLADV